MGKRSTKTTKSGKFMNPTDQWRKESRRKELRKNKKQRQAVREAVIRAKDPRRMLREIEEIEKVEADAGPVPLPNEKSLKEKKKKLEDTLKRVVSHFERDDPKKAVNIKGLILESESKRRDMAKVFRDYQTARSQINVSDIPLPGEGLPGSLDNIPLPGMESGSGPPPPPPGPPPKDLYAPFKLAEDDEDDDMRSDYGSDSESGEGSDNESDRDEPEDSRQRTVRFADDEQQERKSEPSMVTPPGPPPGLPGMPPGPPPGIPPPLIRPPPPPSGLPPRPPFGGPPGPPPGPLPPHLMPPAMPPHPPQPSAPPTSTPHHIKSPAVISAAPTIAAPPVKNPDVEPPPQESATISAEPKLRNTKAEITKFMPTSLRVRRENPKNMKPKLKPQNPLLVSTSTNSQPKGTTKQGQLMAQGDAYDAFMREMSGLL